MRARYELPLRRGDAVVAPGGRIGMVHAVGGGRTRVSVQFGADGPHRHYAPSSLRWATEDEVLAAGMHGVGFNVLTDHERAARAAATRR